MIRKTPIRHHVIRYWRNGTLVHDYYRGSGTPVAKKAKATPKYLDTGFFTHPDGGSGKLTPEAEKLAKQGQIILEIDIPLKYNTPKKIRDYMWKNYHIDIGIDEENEEEYGTLYYNQDLRSEMGMQLEDNVFVIFPKYYVPGYESYWNALVKNSVVHEEW